VSATAVSARQQILATVFFTDGGLQDVQCACLAACLLAISADVTGNLAALNKQRQHAAVLRSKTARQQLPGVPFKHTPRW